MNRLIIIGNGFDIAHDLKTKYSDFINYYWKQVKESSHTDEYIEFMLPGYDLKNCSSLSEAIKYLTDNGIQLQKSYVNYDAGRKTIIKVLNQFFCRINERLDEANWVDVEMEYYNSLKRILSREKYLQTQDQFETESLKQITKLNIEIAKIAEKFDEYLKLEILPNIKNLKNNELAKLLIDDEVNQIDDFLKEFPKKHLHEIFTEFHKRTTASGFAKKFVNTYVLNFNYTNTIFNYLSKNSATILNIHGEVQNPKNPINLGFGDERDKFYSTIEDYNQNEYLKFMKSFYYSNNDNYKRLFDFLEDGSFQIQIMGHSCGLSDGTLLNALFEHKNCISIKVFYHKYSELKEDGEIDNYSQIVRNISRHFNQKMIMREKIVNKDYSQELPQIMI